MVNPTSIKKQNTVGDALVAIGAITPTTSTRKLTDTEKRAAATGRASKVLHAELSDAQYSIAIDICATAQEYKANFATWSQRISDKVAAMYTDKDRSMLLHATKGKKHIDSVGKALATLADTSWARTQYRQGVHKFLFGDDKEKKLPGARGVKTLAPADVARFVLANRDKIAEYVKRINRKDVEAGNLVKIADAMKVISEQTAIIRKACGK